MTVFWEILECPKSKSATQMAAWQYCHAVGIVSWWGWVCPQHDTISRLCYAAWQMCHAVRMGMGMGMDTDASKIKNTIVNRCVDLINYTVYIDSYPIRDTAWCNMSTRWCSVGILFWINSVIFILQIETYVCICGRCDADMSKHPGPMVLWSNV